MTTLLTTVKLILEMYSRGAILSEELGQFEDCRQTTVSVIDRVSAATRFISE
jgi:hypothetical protein